MKLVGHGVDLVEVERIAGMIREHGEQFLERCFTLAERSSAGAEAGGARRRAEYFAGRFAAKEAVLKALGTGLSGGIRWIDVEVLRGPTGGPVVTLTGQAAEVAAELGVSGWLLSISHVKHYAMASAIAAG